MTLHRSMRLRENFVGTFVKRARGTRPGRIPSTLPLNQIYGCASLFASFVLLAEVRTHHKVLLHVLPIGPRVNLPPPISLPVLASGIVDFIPSLHDTHISHRALRIFGTRSMEWYLGILQCRWGTFVSAITRSLTFEVQCFTSPRSYRYIG